MEGYFNVSGAHNAFDDFDIEGKKSFDMVEKNHMNFSPKPVGKAPEVYLNDKERLLKIKVDLDNGNLGYVFSVTGTGYNAQWKCHVCDMVFMGINNLLFHERSMNHSSLMQVSKHHAAQFSKVEEKEGEPAPPGVDEDEETEPPPPTNIQSTLDDFKSTPLIGLEYVVELNDAYEKESTYVCMLCDKKGDPRTVMAHLVSYNHRLKYLEKHFPITYNAINSLPKTAGARKGLAEIVLRISNEMEEKLGRLRPIATDARHFEDQRYNLMCTMNKGKHFIETPDNTFVHLVDRELLTAAALKGDGTPKIIIKIPKPEAAPPKTAPPKTAPPKTAPPKAAEKPKPEKGNDDEDDEIEFQGAFIKGTRVPVTRQLRVRKFSTDAEDKNAAGGSKPEDKNAPAGNKKEDDNNSMCSLSSISSASSSLSPKDSRSKRRSSLSRSRSRSRSDSRARRRRRSRSRSRSRSKGRYRRSRSRSLSRGRRARSPYRRARSRSPRNNYKRDDDKKRTKDREDDLLQEKVKWEKFREEVAIVEKEMLEILAQHEKNPEKHPKYPEEWKLFWNKRYKELQVTGKDPNKHDFKPEWIEFWNRRMRELHEQDFMKKREDLREKLGLPADEAKPHFNRRKKFIRDGPDGPTAGKPRSRSPSPWEEGAMGTMAGFGGPRDRERERELRNRDRDRELDRDFPYRAGGMPRPEWREQRPTSINVLRILTALEQQLGSLGPRVNGVLSDAIALEKVAHGNSDALLRDTQVVVLFETVKEKFKGQLLAGIVERNMVAATRNAINAVSDLLYYAPALLENIPKVPSPKVEPTVIHVPTPPVPSVAPKLPVAPKPAAKVAPPPVPAPDPVSVPGVGEVDRLAIAKEIATALVMQGKTDVSNEELEQLVNAVVGMAQAKAAAPAPAPAPTPVAPAPAVSVATSLPTVPAVTAAPVTVTAEVPVVSVVKPPSQQAPEITGLQLLMSAYNADETKNTGGATQEKVTASSRKSEDLFSLDSLVPQPAARNKSPAKSAAETAAQAVDAFVDELTETDLRLLLQSFKDLPLDEQHGLIRYLKKLEATDPVRVEKLRKYVNLGSTPAAPSTTVVPPEKLQALAKVGQSGRLSPFSSRHQSRNPTQSEPKRPALKLDSDSDDDYSFDDVCKAAKKKVSEQEAIEAEKRKVVEEREEEKRRQEQEAMNKRIQEEKAKAEQAIKELEDREREQRRIVKEKERQEREAAMTMGAANWNALTANNTTIPGQNPSIPPPPVPPSVPPPNVANMFGTGYGDMSIGNFNGGNTFYPNSYNSQYQQRDGYDQQGAYYAQGQQNSAMYQQAGQFNSQPGYQGYGNNPMYSQQPSSQQQGYSAGYNQYHY